MSDEKAKKLFEKGVNFYKEKKLDLAQESFEEALKYSPNRLSILLGLSVQTESAIVSWRHNTSYI